MVESIPPTPTRHLPPNDSIEIADVVGDVDVVGVGGGDLVRKL